MSRAVAAAVIAAVLMLATAAGVHLPLTYAFRRVFGTTGGVIICLRIEYVVAEFAAGRLEPTWSQSARPLALATVAVAVTILSIMRTLVQAP
jgi:hypothetical protein